MRPQCCLVDFLLRHPPHPISFCANLSLMMFLIFPLPPFPLIHDAPPILFIICPPFAFTPSPLLIFSPFSCFPDVFSSPFPLPSLRQELDSNQETEPAPVNTDPDSHSAPEMRLIGLFFSLFKKL